MKNITNIFIMCLFLSKSAFGITTQLFNGHVLWSDCKLPNSLDDKNDTDPFWLITCIHATLASQLYVHFNDNAQNAVFNYGDIYLGSHLNKYFSIHGKWEKMKSSLIASEVKKVNMDKSSTDFAFLQFGNTAFTRLRMNIGRIPAAFGLNRRPLMKIFYNYLNPNNYWIFPDYGIRLTYDDQREAQVDFSYGISSLKDTDIIKSFALRVMYDVPALNGFRFVFSAYGEDTGNRRFGLGLANLAMDGSGTVMEWIRSDNIPVTKGLYDLYFRLNYLSPYKSKTRWVVEFDNDTRKYSCFTIGHDVIMPDYGIFRASVSYYKSRNNLSYWYFTLGVRLSI